MVIMCCRGWFVWSVMRMRDFTMVYFGELLVMTAGWADSRVEEKKMDVGRDQGSFIGLMASGRGS